MATVGSALEMDVYIFRDEIPLTAMGKNDYRALEKEFKYFDYIAWAKEA